METLTLLGFEDDTHMRPYIYIYIWIDIGVHTVASIHRVIPV